MEGANDFRIMAMLSLLKLMSVLAAVAQEKRTSTTVRLRNAVYICEQHPVLNSAGAEAGLWFGYRCVQGFGGYTVLFIYTYERC